MPLTDTTIRTAKPGPVSGFFVVTGDHRTRLQVTTCPVTGNQGAVTGDPG